MWLDNRVSLMPTALDNLQRAAQAGGGLKEAAQQAVTDFRAFASHIDDVGGSGSGTLRASADALERALVAPQSDAT